MRDSRLDAQRGALILLVVFGHILEIFEGWSNPMLVLILRPIYAFHMPAFILLAGSVIKTPVPGKRVLRTFLIYCVFQLLYSLPALVRGNIWHSILYPFWIMWFMLSLCLWDVIAYFLLRSHFSLAISVLLALSAGLFPFDGYILSFSRTLVFLPFFIAGIIYGDHFRYWLDGVPRPIAALTLVLLILCINIAAADGNWFRGALTYWQMNAKPVAAIVSRAMMLVAALLLTLCFLRMIGPSRWLARYGRYTLPVYLFHAAILLPFGKLVGPDILPSSPLMLIMIAISAALALTHGLALSTLDRTIRRIFYSASVALLSGR